VLADPRVVLARVHRTTRDLRPRPFLLAGPVDPATEAWTGRKAPSYVHVRPSRLRTAAAAAVITVVGSGLGIAIAGLPR
jgi:hypothetical protein